MIVVVVFVDVVIDFATCGFKLLQLYQVLLDLDETLIHCNENADLPSDLKLSIIGAVLVFLLGMVMLFYALRLFQQRTAKAAKQLMLSSVFYITMLQIIYVADKFLR